MDSSRKFYGTGVAIVTPFNKDSSIDYESFNKLINYVIDGGVDYIVLFGTTGESTTISLAEKQETAFRIVEIINKRVPLVLGFGSNDTKKLVKELKEFNFSGVDAILSVCPYYNKPNQEGIYYHFRNVCEASPVDVILYNVPGRTVVNMQPDTTIRIVKDCSNVVAIKEATENLDHVMDLIANKPEHLQVLAGDDSLTLAFLSVGAVGSISVLANAFPRHFSLITKYILQGEFEKARQIHYKLFPLMKILLQSGNPSGIKAVLSEMGLIQHNFRMPVYQVSEQQYQLIVNMLQKVLRVFE